MRFRGNSTVNLDAKGRMALPVRFRDVLSEGCEGNVVITIDISLPCLLLYPLPEWDELEESLQALPNVDATTRRVQHLVIGHATDAQLDGSGRVLLPPVLREYARLDKRLRLVGQGRKLEIWSEEVWTQHCDSLLKDDVAIADMSAELASLRF